MERLKRVKRGSERDQLMPLFLLADDSERQVRSYYQHGDLFVLAGEKDDVRGIALVLAMGDGGAELKAVAVAPELQGQGLGKRMIALVLSELRAVGVRQVVVGTANCSIGQLAFYQKAGFRFRRIERGFFNANRGYPEDLEENGIPLRDMVWMDQEL